MRLCAIYTRSARRDRTAIFQQKDHIHAYLKNHREFLIDKEYCDFGFSGRSLERPELLRLLNDILNEKIRMIIVSDDSRLSRSCEDHRALLGLFKGYEITYVVVTNQEGALS